MSKAARNRAKRHAVAAALPPPGVFDPRLDSRVVWIATGSLAVVVAIVVAVLLAAESTPSVTPPAAGVGNEGASAALVAAADAVGFHPTVEPGIGQVENLPASAGAAPSNPNLLPVGAIAPAFTLATPQGERVSLAAYRGKAVLIEFFATWCPHCNAETPHVKALYASLPRNAYAFLSVNGDGETAPSVFAYHRYYGLKFPALLDPSDRPGSFSSPGAAGPVSNAYRIASFPTFYVIDPQGRIFWRGDGEQPDALLRAVLYRASQLA